MGRAFYAKVKSVIVMHKLVENRDGHNLNRDRISFHRCNVIHLDRLASEIVERLKSTSVTSRLWFIHYAYLHRW